MPGSSSCTTHVCYTANLIDSYGDGWDSSKLTITNSDTGVTVQELAQSGSIAKNTAESFEVCVDGCSCFTGQVGGGEYLEETSWNIQDGAGETVAEASNTGSASFCAPCTTVCEEGKQPNAEDSGCEECVAGKFSDTTGGAACTSCAAGSYSNFWAISIAPMLNFFSDLAFLCLSEIGWREPMLAGRGRGCGRGEVGDRPFFAL